MGAHGGGGGVKLLTGSDLPTGDVIWWTGNGWSRHIEDATDEEGQQRVTGPYVIDATATAEGPRPAHIKDRIRALGPTVRPDLTLKPADPSAGSWVI